MTAYLGTGLISYSFQAMNGQYLCNRQITVSYAYKKDTKGERHGTPAERVLAASNPSSKSRPHTLFASGPPTLPNGPQANSAMAAPLAPRPFANGTVAPGPIPALRPAPSQVLPFPPMQVPGQPGWQGQPQQPGQVLPPPVMPPPQMQHFRPPPNMPPPPPQAASVPQRPLPPPMGMAQLQSWRPPPPPQQRPQLMSQGSIPPLPHHNLPPPPPLS